MLLIINKLLLRLHPQRLLYPIQLLKIPLGPQLPIALLPTPSEAEKVVVNMLTALLLALLPYLLELGQVVRLEQCALAVERDQHGVCHLVAGLAGALLVLAFDYLVHVEVFQVLLQSLLFHGRVLDRVDVLNGWVD